MKKKTPENKRSTSLKVIPGQRAELEYTILKKIVLGQITIEEAEAALSPRGKLKQVK